MVEKLGEVRRYKHYKITLKELFISKRELSLFSSLFQLRIPKIES